VQNENMPTDMTADSQPIMVWVCLAVAEGIIRASRVQGKVEH